MKLWVCRVDSELMQGQLFDFQSEAKTGKTGISDKYYFGKTQISGFQF